MPDFGYSASNAYYGPTVISTAAITITANKTYYIPFYVTGTRTFDRIAIRTNSTFSGTSTVRLGVYNNSGGAPSTVKFDAGTVSCTAAGTQYDITISQQLTAGWYWFAFNSQTAATTNSYTGSATVSYPTMQKFPANSGLNFHSPNWTEDSITGAFPTAGSFLAESQSAPLVVLRGA
jgi:hypothetical protein